MARRALYVANGDALNNVQPMTTNAGFPVKAGEPAPQRAGTAANAAASDLFDWQGGYGSAFVTGTFGGATVALQIQAPDGTWVPLGSATNFTSAGVAGFIAPAAPLRFNITGGTAASINGWVVGIPDNKGG